jgi:hypothetical protein
MPDKRIERITSEIHSPGFEIKAGLLAEVLLDAIGPLLFGPDPPLRSERRASVGEPTPST